MQMTAFAQSGTGASLERALVHHIPPEGEAGYSPRRCRCLEELQGGKGKEVWDKRAPALTKLSLWCRSRKANRSIPQMPVAASAGMLCQQHRLGTTLLSWAGQVMQAQAAWGRTFLAGEQPLQRLRVPGASAGLGGGWDRVCALDHHLIT